MVRYDLNQVMRIDLNGDVGESFGIYTIGADDEFLQHITSANVACGLHGGDPSVIRRTVRLALQHGAVVGAHPGFADLQGFGRREIKMGVQELEDLVVYQVGVLVGFTLAEGVPLHHVKPHGALYNMASRDRTVADAVARAVASVDDTLLVYCPSGSCLMEAAGAVGLRTVAEVFADRAYLSDGSLAPRDQPGAVISDTEMVIDRAIRLVREAIVEAVDGTAIAMPGDTLCLHGDTPGAASLALLLRCGLENAGVEVLPFE